MPTLLILWHSRTGASAALADAATAAAQSADERCTVVQMDVAAALPEHFLSADGYLFVGPENLGALTGAMKEMFDRLYYPLLGELEGRPYGHIVAAGSDGHAAAAQLARIATGWRLRAAFAPQIVNVDAQSPEEILAPKILRPHQLAVAAEAGATLAAGLALGIF